MGALILYVVTAGAILFAWHRFVQPIPRGAALVLLLLPTLFTGRALFTGRVYDSSDWGYLYRPLSDYANDLGVHVHNGVTGDPYLQMIPWQAAVRYAWSHHQWPLWNPFMLCGDILAAGMQAAPYDPLNVVGLILPLDLSLTFEASMTFFLAALFAFALAGQQLGARSWELGEKAESLPAPRSALPAPSSTLPAPRSALPALFAAASYMLSSAMAFTIGWAPHTRSWALLPFVLFAVSRVVREHRPALLTIALTLLILAGHPETMLHVVALGVAWGIFEVIRVRRVAPAILPAGPAQEPAGTIAGATQKRGALKAIALAGVSGVLTLLLTAIFLLPFAEAVTQTEEWAGRLTASNEPPGVFRELIAHRAATAFLPWWGGSSWKFNLFQIWDTGAARVGSIVFVLALIGILATWRRGETKFFALLLLVCLGAAFDAPPVVQILHYIPGFHIAVNNRLAFGAALAASLLAASAVEAWPRRGMLIAIVAGIVLTIATGFAIPIQLELHQDDTFLLEMVAIELLPIVILALLLRRPRTAGAFAILFALLLLQRVNEDGNIYPSMPRQTFYPHLPVIDAMRGDAPFRMTGLGEVLIPNTSAVYHLDDVRGYEAMTFARLAKTFPLWCKPQTVFYNRVDDLTKPFLSLMGVRYALTDIGQAPPDGWRIALDDRTNRLLENSRALPRVFAPREIRYGGGRELVADEVSAAVDYSATGWIETHDAEQHIIVNGQATATAKRNGTEYAIDVNARTAAWLIVTESAWRGWRAYVDGHRVRTYYADVAFLGIFVPAGHHQLRVVYLPESFVRGRNISFATLAALAIVLIIRRSRHRGASRGTPPRSDRSG
jgi:membrane protein YfhO